MQQVNSPSLLKTPAVKFVLLLGLVSLCGDFVYEGARGFSGAFLAHLGATGAMVGLVAGFGELLGNALRYVSGKLTDKTRKYWTLIFCGYALNLLSIPALALAGNWATAAALLICERAGKAIRSPARDLVLSDAATTMGRGAAFGLHQTLDQIGAVAGPLFVSAVLFSTHRYDLAFGCLLVPALLALFALTVAKSNSVTHELHAEATSTDVRVPSGFYTYAFAMALIAAGYVDFPLIAFHLYKHEHASLSFVPLCYSAAMAMEALVSWPMGRLFDRKGMAVILGVTAMGMLATPLIFLGSSHLAIAGIALWGLGMTAQNSIAKAAVAGLVPQQGLGRAFGTYGTAYGIAWFAGSATMGWLYDQSIVHMVMFSVIAQLAAIPLLIKLVRERK